MSRQPIPDGRVHHSTTSTTRVIHDHGPTLYLLALVRHMSHTGLSRVDIIDGEPLPIPGTTTDTPVTFDSLYAIVSQLHATPGGAPINFTLAHEMNGQKSSYDTKLTLTPGPPRSITLELT